MTCKDKQENNGVCPHHNLQCGWPKCNEQEQESFEYWNAVEGWVKIDEVRKHFDSVGCGTIYKTAGEDRTPLYTTPPQRPWVGLTDEEIKAFDTWHDNREEEVGWCNPSEIVAYIEAKLRSKNT